MRAALALVLVVTSACRIEDHLVACGELACPVGLVCTAGGCATPEAAAACAGLGDGETCTSSAVPDGTCAGGACYAVGCGNGVVDHGEACDDGNNTYLDGCSADCRSDETCGNAIADPLSGEQCDTAVRGLSSDGCTSRCTNEIELWRDRTPSAITARGLLAMSYDEQREVIVLFGGFDGTWRNDTWEWNGVGWRLRRPAASPPPRNNHTMAYDPVRKRVVVFGGNGVFSALLGDTWEWDGVTWTERTPATQPTARSGAALAYDRVRNVMWMFGGTTDTGAVNELWKWDGTSWTQETVVATWPGLRAQAAFVFDPTTQQMLLFGGLGLNVLGQPGSLNDTWTWNGSVWTTYATSSTPTIRYSASIAADTTRVVLVGGQTLATGSERRDTFAWNGSTWSALADAPAVRAGAGFAFDKKRNSFVKFGGTFLDQRFNDTVRFAAEMWVGASSPTSPRPMAEHVMAHDPLRGRTLLFGGRDGVNRFDEAWEWDGTGWVHRPRPATGNWPTGRNGSALVFDSARRRMVLFGGRIGSINVSETWSWVDGVWTQLTSEGPVGRVHPSMAYDSARDRIVMFGGNATGDAPLGDTWEFDGETWTQVATTGPAARNGAAMAYDPLRQRIVLAGGAIGSAPQEDLWEWDGTTWTQRLSDFPSIRERAYASATYDPIRRVVAIFGGVGIFLARFDAAIEWDGTTLVQRMLPLRPTPRSSTPVVYEPIAHALTIFGGDDGTAVRSDTWQRVHESYDFPAERCMLANEDSDGDGFAGCDDPDCFGRCAPLCVPGASCPASAPRCGDGECVGVEDYLICPADCPVP